MLRNLMGKVTLAGFIQVINYQSWVDYLQIVVRYRFKMTFIAKNVVSNVVHYVTHFR